MTATITDADRVAAHALFERVSGRECLSNTDVHGVSCNDVAQAIADAREAGRLAELERDDYHSRKHLAEALTWIEQNVEHNRCGGIALVARALLAADDVLAARRSR